MAGCTLPERGRDFHNEKTSSLPAGIFVPAGTQVDLSGSAVIEDWSVTPNIGHHTAALGIPHALCSSVWDYNGLPYSVYVVGV